MRFLVTVMSTPETEETFEATPELFEEMGKFNQRLLDAGVLLAGEGLLPSRQGARVVIDGSSRTVVDGPFTESKELVSGYWVLQLSSLDEAIAWVKQVPNPTGVKGEIRIRQIAEAADLADVAPAEVLADEERMRSEIADAHRS